MKAAMTAIIIIGIGAHVVKADDWRPDWMPPPVQQPALDLQKPEQPVKLSDEFNRILFFEANEEPQPGQTYLVGRVKLSREATLESAKWRSNVEVPDPRELREAPAVSARLEDRAIVLDAVAGSRFHVHVQPGRFQWHDRPDAE